MAPPTSPLASTLTLNHYHHGSGSRLPRFLATFTLGNIARATIAVFLFYIFALWVFTFLVNTIHLGFFGWFHAVYIPFKYIRLLGNMYGNVMYQCKPINRTPKYEGKDVTVIVPTITEDMADLVSPFQSLLDTGIARLIIVTVGKELHDNCEMLADKLMRANPGRAKIDVYSTNVRSKREQLRSVIPLVTTRITALVDDDVWWKRGALPWILAPFEDPKMGSVGVGMSVRPLAEGRGLNMKTIFHYLGAESRTRRNFDGASTLYHDNGISCMAGATNVLRTSILQDPNFLNAFTNEHDPSKPDGPSMASGEDKFITRWLIEHDHGMWVQYHPEAYLETTLYTDARFLSQVRRWVSSSWRGNWQLLFPKGFKPWTRFFWTNLKTVSTRQPWTFYAKYQVVFTSWTIISDPFFFAGHWACQPVFGNSSFPGASLLTGTSGWYIALGWYLFTKMVKKIKDLYRVEPINLLFLPVFILFGLYFSIIKLKSMLKADGGWLTRNAAPLHMDCDNFVQYICDVIFWCIETVEYVVVTIVKGIAQSVACIFGVIHRIAHPGRPRSEEDAPLVNAEEKEESDFEIIVDDQAKDNSSIQLLRD